MIKYSTGAFEKAEEELSRRRNNAESEHKRRVEEIDAAAPEISILQKSLANTGMELMQLVVGGGENTAELVAKVREKNIRTQQAIGDLLEAVKGDRHYLDVPYFCDVCKDSGYVNGSRCECFKTLLRKYTTEALNANCHIKMHDFSEFRLDYYEQDSENGFSPREKMTQNFQYCKGYAENFTPTADSLFFFGKTGLGKTFLSSCIAAKVIENGYNVVFGSVLDFFRTIENEHFGRTQGDTLSLIIGCELLILDDLGSEFQTSFTESVLYDIVNSRLNLDRPTIISTNLSIGEFNSKYNERIVSRITGCYTPITFIGKDIRHLKHRYGK